MQKKNVEARTKEILQEIDKHQREIIRLRHELKMLRDVFEEQDIAAI